jgi:RNA polymerase sigma factor (sigma-70 family)
VTQLFKDPLARVDLNTLIGLAQDCKDDDSAAMNEIIRRFEPLTRRLVGAVQAADHFLRDDLANAGRLGLVTAVRRHNGGHGFGNFAKRYMRGAVLREYGRWICPETVDGDAVEREQAAVTCDGETDAVLDTLAPWGAGAVAEAVDRLDPMERLLLELRYLDDAPVWAVAEVTGTTSQAVTQRINTIHRKIALAVAA